MFALPLFAFLANLNDVVFVKILYRYFQPTKLSTVHHTMNRH